MTDTLTAESATAYARNLMASYGSGNDIIAVHSVTANEDSTDDNAALDVAFTYQGGGDHVGVMVVWLDPDGRLYGEF